MPTDVEVCGETVYGRTISATVNKVDVHVSEWVKKVGTFGAATIKKVRGGS